MPETWNTSLALAPGSVSATLGGSSSRAAWIVANRLIYNVIAQPEVKTLQELRGKRICVSGLGATTHTAFTMAVEKAGANPKDFIVVGLGPQQQQRALESKSIEAVIVDPPVLFVLLKKGFSKVLDIGAAVEMPVGGLTTLTKTLGARPDQVRRVIRALQEAKEALIASKERSVDLIAKTMKMDRGNREKTHEMMALAWAWERSADANGHGEYRQGDSISGSIRGSESRFRGNCRPTPRIASRARARSQGLREKHLIPKFETDPNIQLVADFGF